MLNLCALFVSHVLLQNVYFHLKMTKVVMPFSPICSPLTEEMSRMSSPFMPFRGAAAYRVFYGEGYLYPPPEG